MTIPILSTTWERAIRKMKLIKTTTCSTISGVSLNDLCILAVGEDLSMNFEKVIDDFANSHKISRALLK